MSIGNSDLYSGEFNYSLEGRSIWWSLAVSLKDDPLFDEVGFDIPVQLLNYELNETNYSIKKIALSILSNKNFEKVSLWRYFCFTYLFFLEGIKKKPFLFSIFCIFFFFLFSSNSYQVEWWSSSSILLLSYILANMSAENLIMNYELEPATQEKWFNLVYVVQLQGTFLELKRLQITKIELFSIEWQKKKVIPLFMDIDSWFNRIFSLKGVFAKNVRGYRLSAIKKRFWSLLILLLSVASIRRKLSKTSHTE